MLATSHAYLGVAIDLWVLRHVNLVSLQWQRSILVNVEQHKERAKFVKNTRAAASWNGQWETFDPTATIRRFGFYSVVSYSYRIDVDIQQLTYCLELQLRIDHVHGNDVDLITNQWLYM